jgi:hypothetical protein
MVFFTDDSLAAKHLAEADPEDTAVLRFPWPVNAELDHYSGFGWYEYKTRSIIPPGFIDVWMPGDESWQELGDV